VAVGLPLLNMGLPGVPGFGSARAEQAPIPKRFIFMIHPNGVITDSWFPEDTGDERRFDLKPVHAPLASFKDKLVLLSGVDLACGSAGPGEPHQKGMGGQLTGRPLQEGNQRGGDGSLAGWGDGVSIDQVLAERIGADTAFGSLEIGVRADTSGGSEVRTRVSYSGPAAPNPPINDPRDLFDQLFSDFTTDAGALARIRAQKGSVLDSVGDQFNEVFKRAGAADRQRLEEHLAIVRDIEDRLERERITGDVCYEPVRPEDLEPDSENTMPQIARAHMDLLALAMACDLTRVATFQFSNAKNHIRFPWIDSMGDGHALSHAGPSNTTANNEWIARDVWHAEQLAYLLGRLDMIPEGDGTMLDNTLVVWTSEIARGNTHSHKDMPFLLAGSAGGAIDTGRHISYETNRSHNDLLVAILNAFGGEDTTFGDERFCSGAPLPGLV
jgi:hypothetical protein